MTGRLLHIARTEMRAPPHSRKKHGEFFFAVSELMLLNSFSHDLVMLAPGPAEHTSGPAGPPGGTVRRAAVRKNGAPALRVAQSTDFPNEYG